MTETPTDVAPSACVFCRIVKGTEPATVRARYERSIVIAPLNPVTEGHLLVIPKLHVSSARVRASITGDTFADAATYLQRHRYDIGDFNLITSGGRHATQSVNHLHIHVIPRREGDGLALPWTDVPDVEIKQEIDKPTTAKIWRAGVLVFDGVDRFALLAKDA